MTIALTLVLWLSAVVSALALLLPSRTSQNLTNDEACESKKEFCEQARPRFHFTSSTNWINDPNGLHYSQGVYHMFFQHTKSKVWAKEILWGHAVSEDLLHWHQLDDALVAKEGGAWSGSAVVDVANTSGLQDGGNPVVLGFYTHVDYKTRGPDELWQSSQRLVFSNDAGKTFTSQERDGEIILPTLPGDKEMARDPKVVWHERSKQWILVLWEAPGHTGLYASTDLRTWKKLQDLRVDGFECPDFFELKVKGENVRRWVLWFASSKHYIGTFDGRKFTIEEEVPQAEYGMGYASQTFDNMPDGRRVQVSWVIWKSPMRVEQRELPFMGSMSIPMEMDLQRMKNGTLRVRRLPVAEVATLWEDLPSVGMQAVQKLSGTKMVGETAIVTRSGLGLDIEIDVTVKGDSSLEMRIQGQLVVLTEGLVKSEHQQTELRCEPHCMRELPVDGTARSTKIRILSDRSSLEIFDLRAGTSMAVIPASAHCQKGRWVQQIRLVPSGSVVVNDLQVHEVSDKYSLCKKFNP